jgi:ubiquinone biosynthesis protein UbiJ
MSTQRITEICCYVPRQGVRAGQKCSQLVTPLDPQKKYCCAHYRSKTAQTVTSSSSTVSSSNPIVEDVRAQIQSLRAELNRLSMAVEKLERLAFAPAGTQSSVSPI